MNPGRSTADVQRELGELAARMAGVERRLGEEDEDLAGVHREIGEMAKQLQQMALKLEAHIARDRAAQRQRAGLFAGLGGLLTWLAVKIIERIGHNHPPPPPGGSP